MQKMTIMGYVGRDPEERFTSGGKKITSFPMGILITKSGEKLTVWYKIQCWGDQFAAVLPHIKKGNLLIVGGDLNPPATYQNKKGDISIDLSIACQSINFVPLPKKEKKEKNQEDAFDFGDLS